MTSYFPIYQLTGGQDKRMVLTFVLDQVKMNPSALRGRGKGSFMSFVNAVGMALVAGIGVLIALTGKENLMWLAIPATLATLWPIGGQRRKVTKVAGLCAVQVLIAGYLYASWKADGETYLWTGVPLLIVNAIAIIILARRAESSIPPTALTPNQNG